MIPKTLDIDVTDLWDRSITVCVFFFNKLKCNVKLKLFNTYCSSMYGCELWSLSNKSVEEFAVAWRRAVRRVLCFPSGTHCNLLLLINESLPVSLDVCKRSARFIWSCLKSKSKVVRSVASFSVLFSRHESIIGSNAIFLLFTVRDD